jgi:ribosome modulation factor
MTPAEAYALGFRAGSRGDTSCPWDRASPELREAWLHGCREATTVALREIGASGATSERRPAPPETTREEAFRAVMDRVAGLQRSGVLSYEEASDLDTLICAYGAAAAREAAREARARSFAHLRPGAPVVRRVDGVEWVE